jgi:DNA-directed RNA polymerase subunit RPC12/RpoP
MSTDEFDGDEGKKGDATDAKSFNEFDCPLCNANNPYDESFRDGDEVRCFYCGSEFRVRVDENGKIRLRET